MLAYCTSNMATRSAQRRETDIEPDTVVLVAQTVQHDISPRESDLDMEQNTATGTDLTIDPALDERLNELIDWKFQEHSTARRHDMSDSDSPDAVSITSTMPVLECIPTRQKQKKRKRNKSEASNKSESGLSEGDRYRRGKVVSKKVKKSKKHKKRRRASSSSSSSESSFPSSDEDVEPTGVMEKHLARATKKKRLERNSSVRVRKLLRTALEGHLATFKPVEVITRGAEVYTGVKGVEESFSREMDTQVLMMMTDVTKRYEKSMCIMQTAVLLAMSAMVPVANRMANEDKFTTLAKGMNDGLELLAAASMYATYRRFENVFKSVTTEAGKEVTRSKKIKDKDGKEYTLFLPPKPLKGKAWDKTLMFGGQVPFMLKAAESSSKCGRQMGPKRAEEQFHYRRPRYDSRQKRGSFRGARGGYNSQPSHSFRGRPHRQPFGWNDSNRPAFRAPAAQGKPTGFQRGGAR